jgi:hypothetical protein
MSQKSGGRITGNHVYAARLHDVRFRQLETGLPAQFQTPEEIKKQRKIHDKLIEKGLQLIADSFLDQLGKRCETAGVALTRQLLEGINYDWSARQDGNTTCSRSARTDWDGSSSRSSVVSRLACYAASRRTC